MAVGKNIAFDAAKDSKTDFDFNVPAITAVEYVAQVVFWQRLCMLEPNPSFEGDDFNSSEYWREHILVFDVLQEHWAAETVVGFTNGGQKILDLLSTRLDVDQESQDYKDAYKLV